MLKSKKLQIILICIIFIISLSFSPLFPNTIPMHYDSAGKITRYGSKYELLLLFPIILVVFYIISIVVEKLLKPKDKVLTGLEYFRLYFLILFGGMQVFFIVNALNK